MCNINILIRTTKTSPEVVADIPGFLMGVTSMSYASNNHGEGMFAEPYLHKGPEKINMFRHDALIRDSMMVMTHQRIATSGLSKKYTQPFSSKEFVFAHNGIMSEYSEMEKSDTYILFQKFQEEFDKAKGKREAKIVSAIKVCVDNKYGTYSIAIYDRIAKNIYYFKNSTTDMTIFLGKTMVYMATEEDNGELLSMFGDEFKMKRTLKVDPYIIYRCDASGDDVQFYWIGKIEEPSYTAFKDAYYPRARGYDDYGYGIWYSRGEPTFKETVKLPDKTESKEKGELDDCDLEDLFLSEKEEREYLYGD